MKALYEFWFWMKEMFGFGSLGGIHAFTVDPEKDKEKQNIPQR